MSLNRTVRTLALAMLLILGTGSVAPLSAATIYESTFDDFAADWLPVTPLPTVTQGAGIATLAVDPPEPYGRADSIPIISTGGADISTMIFSVDMIGTAGAGALVWIAYFEGVTFHSAEEVFNIPAGGPVNLVRDGNTLAAIPGSADGFKLVLYAFGSGTFDRLGVTAPFLVPEPSLALPSLLAILAMMHVRARSRRS